MNRENRFSSDINNLELEQNQFQNTQQRNAQQPFQSNSSQQNLQSQVPQIVLNSQQKKQMFQKQQIQHITQENITDNKNLVIQTQGPSFKNSLGVQHTFNLSPYVNTDQQNEENKFTFEKIDNQNRDKVDSYQSATFRKGSELIYSQTNQMGSISSLQNDQNMTNSQYIAQQLVGSKQNNFQKSSIVLNSTFVNQNQQQSNISQNYSSIQDPYLVLTNKNVSTKQFMQKLKECLQSDYDNKIVGLLKFAQIYMKFQEGKFIQNQSLQAEATQIYDDSFQIPLKNNQQDFSQQFLHDYQKMFLYQKSVGLGMTAQRQACIQNGQICQPIEDKSQKRSKSPICQQYKKKEIAQFVKIEEKGQKINISKLKWVTETKNNFRVILQDKENKYLAVYTENLQEAVKIRDYFLFSKLQDRNSSQDINLIGLFKKCTIHRQKDKFIQFFIEKLIAYTQQLKIKQQQELLLQQKQQQIQQQLMQQQVQQSQLLLQQQMYQQQLQLEKEKEKKQKEEDMIDCDIELDQQDNSQLKPTNQSNSPFQSNKFMKKKQNNDSIKVDPNKSQNNISQISDKTYQSAQINFIDNQQIDSHRNDNILDEESVSSNAFKINESNNNNTIRQQKKENLQIPEIRDVFLKNQSIFKEYDNLQKQFDFQDESEQNNFSNLNDQIDKQNQLKWSQRDCKNIIMFTNTNNKIQIDRQSVNIFFNKIHFLRDYDKILKSAFREQLKMRIRNRAECEIYDIKKKIQDEKEKADISVDIFLTFQELKFEFKDDNKKIDDKTNDSGMVFKPKLRLQIMKKVDFDPKQKILSDLDDNKPKMQYIIFGDQKNQKNVAELKARVFSKQGNFKEFELYGDQKVADIRNVKLVAIKKNEMKIEILDEITGSLIAKNSIKMEKILSKNDFMSSQITIEPVQSLCNKLAIQVSLQSLTVEQKNSITFQDNNSRINQTEIQEMQDMRINNLSQYIETILAKQNYILDNFYQCRIFLEHFSPSQFKILLELIQELKLDATPLQLSLRKQSNKLQCYQQVRAILFKYYLEQQSYHQSILVKNLNSWNILYDNIVAQVDIVEYGNSQSQDNNYLDTSDNFILRDACDEIKKFDFDAGNDYIQQMLQGRDSVSYQDDMMSNRRIVTSVFYKRDIWEQDTSQKEFYEEMLKNTEKGIPNSLRQTLWLELGKSSKFTHMINRLLSLNDKSAINHSLNHVYQNLLKQAYQFKPNQYGKSFTSEIQDMQSDIYWYKEYELFIDDQMLISLTNIFYAYCYYIFLQNGRVIYSKYLIPFAAKALDYFKSESKESDDSIEENAFWLVVCFTNNFAKRYYNTQLMMEIAQQVIQEQLLEQSSKPNNSAIKTDVTTKSLVQSQISMLPANNPSNNSHQKIQTKLNYIPDDIRLDMLIFEFNLKEKNQKLYNFLQNISFGIGLYFAERMLSYFSDLFNHELLFRIWDYLFVEGSSKNTLKATYFGIAVMIHFLDKNSKSIISKCRSKKDTLLYLQLAAKFQFDCDKFISEAVKLYKSIIEKDPVRFPKDQQQQQSTTNPAVALAKTTKLIFHQIISVSNKIFNQTLQNFLETVDQGYKQLDMQRYLNQIMTVQTFVQHKDKDTQQLRIDLDKLKKIIELELAINQNFQESQLANQNSKSQSQLVNELSVQNVRSRSTSNISGTSYSQTRNQQIQMGLQIENIKPIYNIYSKQPKIQKVFIYIHQIQIIEDYNELNVEVKFANEKSVHLIKRLSTTQIIECFDIEKANFNDQNREKAQKAITITIYGFQENTVRPVKQTKIYFSNYQPDVITKDYTIMYEYKNVDDYFFNSNGYNENDKSQVNNQNYKGRGNNVKDIGKPQYKYDSGVEFSILLATSHGMGESQEYQNILQLKRTQTSNNISLTGNQVNIQNISSYLIDKYNYVPEIFHVRKNQQAESKLKQFNQLKSENYVEIIQNKSLNTIKNIWKQKTIISTDEFKEFIARTNLLEVNELNIKEIKNHFSYEGRICLFDFLLVCILLVEGRYLEKVDILRKLFQISAPVQVCEEMEKQKKIDNPFVYTSIINELYCKNILFLPLNLHFQSLKLKNLPHIEKAKYFLENQSVQSQGSNQNSQKQLGDGQNQNNQPINEAQSQSRVNKTVDITIFMQSFCAQQSLFKGTFDIFIDSPEFSDALKQYLKDECKVDNPSGNLQAFYWTKGQLRQLQAKYTYQALGLVLNYVKQQKTKLSKNESISQTIQIEQDVKNQNKQQMNSTQSVYKLLQFNDTLVNLNYDSHEIEEQEVNNTFLSLPLLSYFNSLQNSVYQHSRPNRKKNLLDKFKKEIILKVSIDNVLKGQIKLVESEKKQEQQFIQEEVSYSNKQFRTILEDWNIIKNLQNLPYQNNLKLDKIVLNMSIDHVPLNYKIKDLARLLIYRIMESCINKVEQYYSQIQDDKYWICFFNQIKYIDLIQNLEGVYYQDQNSQLDPNLNLEQNLNQLLKIQNFQNVEQILFNFSSQEIYSTAKDISRFEKPQQYAIYNFKDGGKLWMPCEIEGYVEKEKKFQVRFHDFPECTYLKEEEEIAVDQDIQILNIVDDEDEIYQNDQQNHNHYHDNSVNMTLETQNWDQSQYGLTNTRINTSQLNVMNTSNNFNYDYSRYKNNLVPADGSSYYQPTQEDMYQKEMYQIQEFQNQKTYENFQTEFDSPIKTQQYQKQFQ